MEVPATVIGKDEKTLLGMIYIKSMGRNEALQCLSKLCICIVLITFLYLLNS